MTYVTEKDVRNFFTTPLDYDDVSKAQIDLYIEAVEDFVEAVYFNDSTTTSAKARIPCLLLIASKVIYSNPELAKKYSSLSSERLGDYAYTLGGSGGSSSSKSPHEIAKSWEELALMMLRSRTTNKKYYVDLVND